MNESKGRYWDKPWSNLLSSSVFSFSIRIRYIMFFRMAIKAKRDPIGNFVSQFWKICKFLNVMGMKIAAFIITASGTGEMISLKNSGSPFSIFGNSPRFMDFRCYSTFPIWIIGPVKRSVAIFSLSLTKFAELSFLGIRKGDAFSPFIISTSFGQSFTLSFCYYYRLLYFDSMTGIASNMKTVMPRSVFGILRSRFPFFAFLTTLVGFTKIKIFIDGKTKFFCPSSEYPFSLFSHFHSSSQYYHGGY